ncbi:hypothetical protein V9T40_009269 [Parthenolecanium corni]|uniref:Uncharacterized protein n=1 Tax=Parthenolecanium corni TaxID=536013 RepID=A0AAN9TPP3_9HEMI
MTVALLVVRCAMKSAHPLLECSVFKMPENCEKKLDFDLCSRYCCVDFNGFVLEVLNED